MKALILTLILASCGFSQAVRFDSVSSTTSSQCAPSALCNIQAIPGTTVNVCSASPLGTVNTSGTSVTWVSGQTFTLGQTAPITIAGQPYQIASVNSTTSITLRLTAGTQSGVPYSTLAACLASPATTYSGATAGTPCPNTAQITPQAGGPCGSTSDNQGNYGFWLLPGQYSYYLTIPRTAGGGSYGPYPISVGASAGCPLGYAACDANYNTLQAAVTAAGGGALYVTKTWTISGTVTGSANGLSIVCNGNGAIKAASGSFALLSMSGAQQSVTGCQFNANGHINIVGIFYTGQGNFTATWNNFTGNNSPTTGMSDICIGGCATQGPAITGVYLGHNQHVSTAEGDVLWNCDGCEVDGDYFYGQTLDGIFLDTELNVLTNGTSDLIHNNVFENIMRYCLEYAGNGLRWIDFGDNSCVLNPTTHNGGFSGGSDNSGGATDQSIGGVIHGNSVYSTGTACDGCLAYENYGHDLKITDNIASGSGLETGFLYGCFRCKFEGNSIVGIGEPATGIGFNFNPGFNTGNYSTHDNIFKNNYCFNNTTRCIVGGFEGDEIAGNHDFRAPGAHSNDSSVQYFSIQIAGANSRSVNVHDNDLNLVAPVNGFSLGSPGSFSWSGVESAGVIVPVQWKDNKVTNQNATQFGNAICCASGNIPGFNEAGNIYTNLSAINPAGTTAASIVNFSDNVSLIGTGSGSPVTDFSIINGFPAQASPLPTSCTTGTGIDGTGGNSCTSDIGGVSSYSFFVQFTASGTPGALTNVLFVMALPVRAFTAGPSCTATWHSTNGDLVGTLGTTTSGPTNMAVDLLSGNPLTATHGYRIDVLCPSGQ